MCLRGLNRGPIHTLGGVGGDPEGTWSPGTSQGPRSQKGTEVAFVGVA